MHTVEVGFVLTHGLADPAVEALSSVLSAGERTRSLRFRKPQDRVEYIVAHALTRQLLSGWGQLPPEDWQFDADRHGKPHVVAPQAGVPPMQFNLSHTDGLVACAVTRGAAVGVDVEPLGRRVHSLPLARRFFDAGERGRLEALPTEQQQTRFLELWTLKESFLKATGDGLSRPLRTCVFDWPDGQLSLELDGLPTATWHCELWEPAPGFRLGLTVDGAGQAPIVRLRQVDGTSSQYPTRRIAASDVARGAEGRVKSR